MRRFLLTTLSIALSMTLFGCTATRTSTKVLKVANNEVTHRQETIRKPVLDSSSFEVSPTFYAAKEPLKAKQIEPSELLPRIFKEKNTKVNEKGYVSLDEMVTRLTDLSGNLIAVLPDVYDGIEKSSRTSSRPSQGTPVNASSSASPDPSNPAVASTPPALPPLPIGGVSIDTTTGSVTDFNRPTETLMVQGFYYDGNLAGLLDAVAVKFGISWRWNNKYVEFYRYETRRLFLDPIDGSSSSSSNLSLSASTSSSSGSGGTSGSTGQSISSSTKQDVWNDVEKAIKELLSDGGTFTAVPSAGIITVRDTPRNLDIIETHVKELNKIFSRQVVLNVEVYSVERRDSDQTAIDWSTFWSRASSNFGFALTSGLTNTASPGGGTFGPTLTADFTDPTSPFTGTSAVFSALSTLGKTTLLTSGEAITTNGQSVPFNISREKAYLKQYSTNITGGDTGTVSTTLTPDTISEGFSMSFLPKILEDNTVKLRYSVDLASIEGIETFETPDGLAAIQLPQRSVRNFMQNVDIRSGETLVLTGFQQLSASQSSSGPLSGNAWFLGGSKGADLSTVTVVITVTPYVTQR